MAIAGKRLEQWKTARDFAVAIGVVVLILGGLFVYADNWPPMVVVESGSMMHPVNEVFYGRIGTMDPGDVVLVKKVRSVNDVDMWVSKDARTYGNYGDVIVYYRDGNLSSTPIIHRAITWVTVNGSYDAKRDVDTRTYSVRWLNGTTMHFDSHGIYLPELRFDETHVDASTGDSTPFTKDDGYKPHHSGFITWGDNRGSNRAPDQQLGISPEPVELSWVEGKARFEVPWFGLIKLAFGDHINQYNPNWVRFPGTNAYAPADLWTCFLISSGLLVCIPLGYDVWKAWRARRAIMRGETVATTRPDAADGDPTQIATGRLVLLTVVTLGGYAAVWTWRVARRLRELSGVRVADEHVTASLVFPGALLAAPAVVGAYQLALGVHEAERVAGVAKQDRLEPKRLAQIEGAFAGAAAIVFLMGGILLDGLLAILLAMALLVGGLVFLAHTIQVRLRALTITHETSAPTTPTDGATA